MLQLLGGNQYRCAGGEADNHRVGDKIDQHPHPRQAQCQLEQANHEGEGERQGDVLRAAGDGVDRQGREQHHRRRCGRSGDQVARGAEQGGDDGRHHAGVEAVLRRHAGDSGEGDALWQHHDGTGEGGSEIGFQGVALVTGHPVQEGKQ